MPAPGESGGGSRMIALYRPGRSPVHRLPAGAKLSAFAVAALVVSLWPHTVVSALGTLLGVFALYLLGGQGPAAFARQLWAAKWIVVLLVAMQAIFATAEAAVTVTARVVAIVLLAGLVTVTTRMGDLLDTVERALRPLRRWGVDPSRVAFVVSLTIAAIPVVGGLTRQIGDAQRARGVRPSPRAIVPLIVLALRHADDTADALTARGIV